jgi:hypothetical protein
MKNFYFDIIENRQLESAIALPNYSRAFNPRAQYIGADTQDTVTVRTVAVQCPNKRTMKFILRNHLAEYRQGFNIIRETVEMPRLRDR